MWEDRASLHQSAWTREITASPGAGSVRLSGTLQIKKSICTQVRRGRVGTSAKRQSPARDTDSDVRHQGRRQLPEGWGVGRKHAGKPPQAQGPPQPPPQPTILASVRFLGPGWEGAYPSTCTEQGVVLSCRGEDVTVLRQRLRKPTWEPHAAIRAPPAPCPARLLPHLPQPRCETFAPRSPKYGALALCRKT